MQNGCIKWPLTVNRTWTRGQGWFNFSGLIDGIKGEQLGIHHWSHSSFCELKYSSLRYLVAIKGSYTDNKIESNSL